jgi:phage terminase large subunit GpA-like protein
MSASTVAKCIGSSHDGRTNRWRVTCPACGHAFEPLTTRLATQHLQCPKPKCNAGMFADYNAEPATVTLIETAAEKGQQNG